VSDLLRGGHARRQALIEVAGSWQLRPPASDAPLAVSEVNALARDLIEGVIPPLWVHGEVTGWKRYGSGHCYFCLRDADAQLRAVMFRSDAQRLPADPGEGMQVRAFGTLTLYEKRGDYQLVVRELDALGAGGLWRVAFERLRSRLEAEGLLAPERKRPIPRSPKVVAVVTSPVGAALHDITTVIARRAPWTRVVVAPARVQGEGAAQEIAEALRLVGESGIADVVIVGRGGGSMEDLWAFNEEVVARAIVACPIPVISAVGHEVDVTIADLVADLRAPTPSAAAEHAVPDGRALARAVDGYRSRLADGLRAYVTTRRRAAERSEDTLRHGMRLRLRQRGLELAALAGRLEALSPLSALRRGYAVPLDPTGRLLRTAAEFEPGAAFHLRVSGGSVTARVESVEAEESDGE
jgi:exodeoxyribonuclease VII large subunit